MDADRASCTAVLVCLGRAVAHGRLAVDRFDDPTAMALLREDERAQVELTRGDVPPRTWRDRMTYEQLRATAEVMVARTVAIDDAIRARPAPQLVILGAGLDGRAWRMPELADVAVLEVDHPASQRDKLERLGRLEPLARSVRFVPVDFTRDELDAALASAGHHASAPTTWIWEGVVPYLTPTEVASTVRVVAARSAPGSRVVVEYLSRSLAGTIGGLLVRAAALVRLAEDTAAGEPRRSTWTRESMRRLLGAHGFRVDEDEDLYVIAQRLGVEAKHRRSLAAGRVAVAGVR